MIGVVAVPAMSPVPVVSVLVAGVLVASVLVVSMLMMSVLIALSRLTRVALLVQVVVGARVHTCTLYPLGVSVQDGERG